MRPSWVAATVRARLVAGRGVGRERALEIARSPTLAAAVAEVAGSVYGEAVHAHDGLAAAQRAVAETALWQLRVLAGWLPPGAGPCARALAGWFEIANVDDRLAAFAGAPSRPPFALGSLASASRRIAAAASPSELRAALAASEWGDPGSDEPAAIARAVRIAWLRRALDVLPGAETWALGATALLLARDIAAERRPFLPPRSRIPELGSRLDDADGLRDLAARLSPHAAWALAGVATPDDLWLAEARWWQRVEDDAHRMVRGGDGGAAVVIAAAALVAVDARRVIGALAAAARGGRPEVLEVLGAAA